MNGVCLTSLFPKGYRASGVALDVAALPSPYGIGDVGPGALRWVDRLSEAGQSWWHALESCDSAFQSQSSFAGNTLLISPDWLMEDGLLSPRDCKCVSFQPETIDYDVVIPFKHWLLEKAWTRFNAGTRKELSRSYEQFRKKQAHWLEDYALFRALKARYRGADYRAWPADLVRREPAALSAARQELTRQIDQVRFSQFLLSRQTQRLKEYARAEGVRLIGDFSRAVSDDSSDAWANRELFVCDEAETASSATNLAPFCFSSNDRLGHNGDPGALRRVSYRWCVDRLRALLAHVDAARVDVPASTTLRRAVVGMPATRDPEYLAIGFLSDGDLTAHHLACPPTRGLSYRDLCRVVETHVLQFAFDGCSDNRHLPQNHAPNSVVYTGLNNESRTRAWFEKLPDEQRQDVWNSLKRSPGSTTEIAWELIRLAWSSKAALSIVTVPDLLNLGSDSFSLPGRAEGHCRWRCTEEMLSAHVFYRLRELTGASNRSVEETKSTKPVDVSPSRRGKRIAAVL